MTRATIAGQDAAKGLATYTDAFGDLGISVDAFNAASPEEKLKMIEAAFLSSSDRSAAYAARYAAKNVVKAGLADRCEIQLAYAIGVAEPVSIHVDCFGTNNMPTERIAELIRKHFPVKPADIIRELDLKKPRYLETAAYGHFGRDDQDFTWEKTDQAKDLAKYLK